MKTKYAKGTLQALKKMISRKLHLKSVGLIKEQNLGELSKNFAWKQNLEVYSTMSETKAAFAERAIQSLKHIIYRYIDNLGEKFAHNLPQFVSTMNFRVKRSLYNKPLTRYRRLKFKVGD